MNRVMFTLAASPPAASPLATMAIAGRGACAVAPSRVVEHMRLVTGKINGKPGWAKITNSSWTVHNGQTGTVQIVSFDDGSAPFVGMYTQYTKVMGTINVKEVANGKSVINVLDINVARTFSVPGLGFNMPIPVAATGDHIVVTASFVANKTGTFVWHDYAPCGSDTNGVAGATSTMDSMTGKVTVVG